MRIVLYCVSKIIGFPIRLILTACPWASKIPEKLKAPSVSLSRSWIWGRRRIQLIKSIPLVAHVGTYPLELQLLLTSWRLITGPAGPGGPGGPVILSPSRPLSPWKKAFNKWHRKCFKLGVCVSSVSLCTRPVVLPFVLHLRRSPLVPVHDAM